MIFVPMSWFCLAPHLSLPTIVIGLLIPRGGGSLMFPKVPQSSLGILTVPQLPPPPLEHPPLGTLQYRLCTLGFFFGGGGGTGMQVGNPRASHKWGKKISFLAKSLLLVVPFWWKMQHFGSFLLTSSTFQKGINPKKKCYFLAGA